MSDIQSGISLNQAGIKPIDMSKLKLFHVSEAPEEEYRRFMETSESMLKHKYSAVSGLTNNPTYNDYATVKVGGKVVATVNNQGFVQSSNAIGSKLRTSGMPGLVNGQNGPVLAQARAEFIADLLGGEVVKSSTAMTQSQFKGVPAPRTIVDLEAMKQDPGYAMLEKTREARTLFLAQQLAQDSITG